MEYVRIGHIVNTFGLKGEVKVFPMTDFVDERFQPRTKLTLLNEKTGVRFETSVKRARFQGDVLIVTFEGVENIDVAEGYKGWFVEIEKDSAPLPEGYVRLEDLKGCEVFSTDGSKLGKVTDIQTYATTPNMVVTKEGGKRFYVPFIDVFVKDTDLENKKILIEVVEGMI